MESDETLSIVELRDRPDLAPLTGQLRWEAFFCGSDRSLADVLAAEAACAVTRDPLPRTFVLLSRGAITGMASLAAQDLDPRPDLSPWLAGVFVKPDRRGRGHASQLVITVENAARIAGRRTLWLYTRTAERLYARLGWNVAERFRHKERDHALMRRALEDGGPP